MEPQECVTTDKKFVIFLFQNSANLEHLQMSPH